MTHPALHDLGTLATWLADNVAELRQLEAAGEAWEDITADTDNAWRHIDTPPHRTIANVGPCPHPKCGGWLRAYIPHQHPAHITCTGPEHHRYDPHQWSTIGRLVTPSRRRTNP